MCNPRRVKINLNRQVEEAWLQTVEQVAQVTGEVTEQARVQVEIPLGAEMGDLAMQMFERVLAGEFTGFTAWDRDQAGRLVRDLGEVTLVYNPQTRQLGVETQLSEVITAEARAAAEASGITIGEVVVEAAGNYYDDGWGGRTEQRALEEAQAQAERRLSAAIQSLHLQQHAQELQAAEARAREEAQANAAAELERRQAETRQALRQRLQITLAQAEERVYHVINRAVGEAYRQTLRHLVLNNGGRVIADQQTGSVINLELELF